MTAPARPDRRCRHCAAATGLRLLPPGPLTLIPTWECVDGCPPPVLDLDALDAMAAAATDGPWTAHDDGLVWADRIGDPVSGSVLPEDAALIAAARNALPALVAEVRKLRAKLAAATPQVLTAEPGPEVTTVWDCDGDKWTRHPDGGWRCRPLYDLWSWEDLADLAPITATPPVADR
ncbi:hypothetical protein ABZ847_29290 [Streptomyces bauhiniae]